MGRRLRRQHLVRPGSGCRDGRRARDFHQEHVGVFSIGPVDLIAGDLPRVQRRLVEAWAELHRAELQADWDRLQEGRPALPIAPLQ